MTPCRRLHVSDLLDSRAAAKRAGVEYQTWRDYVSRGIAPEPIARLGQSSAWTAAQIDEWLKARAPLRQHSA